LSQPPSPLNRGGGLEVSEDEFLPDLTTDGDVKQCNNVFGKWVVDHGYGFSCDSGGTATAPPWGSTGPNVPAPQLESGVVEDAAPTIVVLDFDGAVSVTDETGMTVDVDTTPATINNVSADGDQLSITLSSAISNGEVVEFSYNSGTGNLVAAGEGGAAVASITDAPVTNNVT
jgi:hypothetical protein